MEHIFDAMETTHGDGGVEGLKRRQEAWSAIAQWLRQLTASEEGQPVQPSLFDEATA